MNPLVASLELPITFCILLQHILLELQGSGAADLGLAFLHRLLLTESLENPPRMHELQILRVGIVNSELAPRMCRCRVLQAKWPPNT